MTDIAEILAAARLPETTVPLCLRGDLAAEVEELERQLATQEATPRVSIASGGDARATAERIAELQSEMEQVTVPFRLRAMPRHEWTKFMLEHAPRPADEADVRLGFNRETIFDALVRRSVVQPVLTEGQWGQLDAVLTDSQFNSLADAAWSLNRRDVSVPFSPTASRILNSGHA